MLKERKIVIWSHPAALIESTYTDSNPHYPHETYPAQYNYDLKPFFPNKHALEKYNIHLGCNFGTNEEDNNRCART